MNSNTEINHRIIQLTEEHRDLDRAITALIESGHSDELQLKRLKKRKLQLKDCITLLQMQIIYDEPT